MARGRLISRTLGTSQKFAALAVHLGRLGEFAQVLYPLIVSHSDDYGRMKADAFTVKHAVFPISPRREAEFETALEGLAHVDLIERYRVDGAIYLQINDFSEHQPGLHKRTASRFPEPPGNSRKVAEIPPELEGNLEEELVPPYPPRRGERRLTAKELQKAREHIARIGGCGHGLTHSVGECARMLALSWRGEQVSA